MVMINRAKFHFVRLVVSKDLKQMFTHQHTTINSHTQNCALWYRPVFPKLCAVEDLQVFRGVPRVLSKCFVLLQIFCQNRENAALQATAREAMTCF